MLSSLDSSLGSASAWKGKVCGCNPGKRISLNTPVTSYGLVCIMSLDHRPLLTTSHRHDPHISSGYVTEQ